MTDLLAPADLARVVNLEDFEPLARERMTGPAFDYVAGGAWDEITLRESVEAWRRHRFVPRVLRDVRRIDLTASFLGRRAALPIAIAPMAAQTLAHPGGEAAMFAGAAARGLPYCFSTSSTQSLEDVAEAAPDGERWFQLYVVGGMDYSRTLVERAAAAGYGAIVLTVDLPVFGHRERDNRSGFSMPPRPLMAPLEEPGMGGYGALEDEGSGLTWDNLAEIHSWSTLPLVVKGILSPDDARLSVEVGVDAIVVSNHGGRQLDRAITSADALPGIVAAVDGRCEVWVDGGIRRGLDVLAALALGATGVLVGRPIYWALAAAGQAGVEHAVDLLRVELETAMGLVGCTTLSEVSRELLA